MGSHRPHPDVHIHLADDCEGCAELAENPFANADTDLLRRFLSKATENPRTIPDGYNEAVAVKNVLDTLERVGRLAEAAPELVAGYLRDRWRIDLGTAEG